MVKKRVLDPIPALDEALLSQALREEGIKEVLYGVYVYNNTSSTSSSQQVIEKRVQRVSCVALHL